MLDSGTVKSFILTENLTNRHVSLEINPLQRARIVSISSSMVALRRSILLFSLVIVIIKLYILLYPFVIPTRQVIRLDEHISEGLNAWETTPCCSYDTVLGPHWFHLWFKSF